MPLAYQDPVHGEFNLPDRFRRLIENRALSRLRNIKQLGLTASRYPGAVHSRFEHTLGTAAVANDFLGELDVIDRDTVSRVTLACLLSEIGITPLSYSTRSVFQSIGLDKETIRAKIYNHSLKDIPGVAALGGDRIVTSGSRFDLQAWDSILPYIGVFSYMDFVKLASTVDYVMRDAHYCGRGYGAFDYRRFRIALRKAIEDRDTNELFDELQALHRAIYSLNTVYGDSDRRVLTIVMNRLAKCLIEAGALKIDVLTDAAALVELDDDQFLGDLIDATKRTTGGEADWYRSALNVVVQHGECKYYELNEFLSDEEASTSTAVAKVAADLEIETWQVVILGGSVKDDAGFRLFGSEFLSPSLAIASDLFLECTGLDTSRMKPAVPGPACVGVVGT